MCPQRMRYVLSKHNYKSNFWTILPGIFTGITAIITAIGDLAGLIGALKSTETSTSAPTSTPATAEKLTAIAFTEWPTGERAISE